MNFTGLSGRTRRAWTLWQVHGTRRFAAHLASWIGARFAFRSAAQSAFLQSKAAADAAFDAAAGVSTGGVQHLYGLTINSGNARFGTNHVASDPAEFQRAMQRIDIDLSGATFIDFGSGRGRALIMAALLPFTKVIGIEFAEELHRDGIQNISQSTYDLGQPGRIDQILGDATQFEFPDTPLVLYLFNPFDAPIVAEVARNALASWQAHPRPMRVIYLNPIFGGEWQQAGWRLLESGEGRAIFGPPSAGEGASSMPNGAQP
jgi:SAM-dependent methyltransferase